jgi:hypothetical protein
MALPTKHRLDSPLAYRGDAARLAAFVDHLAELETQITPGIRYFGQRRFVLDASG